MVKRKQEQTEAASSKKSKKAAELTPAQYLLQYVDDDDPRWFTKPPYVEMSKVRPVIDIADVNASSNRQVWLLQLPSSVSVDSLHGATMELPNAGEVGALKLESEDDGLLDAFVEPQGQTAFTAFFPSQNEGTLQMAQIARRLTVMHSVQVPPAMQEADQALPRASSSRPTAADDKSVAIKEESGLPEAHTGKKKKSKKKKDSSVPAEPEPAAEAPKSEKKKKKKKKSIVPEAE